MFFIVGLIALALAIAAIFGLQLHPEAVQDVHLVVLMVFASPVIAAVYGGLTLIVCNLISSWSVAGQSRRVRPRASAAHVRCSPESDS